MSEPLFCYCLEIADREFLIAVDHNGVIRWDDYQTRRRERSPSNRYLEIETALGDADARNKLSAEISDFAVSFPLSPELLDRIREAARLLADEKWTASNEEQLDKLLIPLFWSEVNPRLNNPIQGS